MYINGVNTLDIADKENNIHKIRVQYGNEQIHREIAVGQKTVY